MLEDESSGARCARKHQLPGKSGLREACAGDGELRREVDEMLRYEDADLRGISAGWTHSVDAWRRELEGWSATPAEVTTTCARGTGSSSAPAYPWCGSRKGGVAFDHRQRLMAQRLGEGRTGL